MQICSAGQPIEERVLGCTDTKDSHPHMYVYLMDVHVSYRKKFDRECIEIIVEARCFSVFMLEH